MSTKNIISKKLNVNSAGDFVESIKSDSTYYVFTAKHTPYLENSDATITSPTDSVKDIVVDAYNNMIFGKKVGPDDVVEMISRFDWTSGTQYSMYDDQDPELQTKSFYATVNTGAEYHVYKCLYNGNGEESTVEPSGTATTAFETPNDGYIWKYMYSANSFMMDKFATTQYMPVVANSDITEAATPGSIEVIKVEDGGIGYNNYLLDSFRLASDLRIGGNPLLYSLGPNANPLNDYYNGCIIYMTSGGAEGEYKIITDYYINGEQKIAALDSAFAGTVGVNDTFEIYPYVYVFDTGGVKSSNCIARAIVSNTSGNSISKVEIIQPGAGYRSATAVILPANVVAVSSEANLRSIISPPDGHGSDVKNELGANYVGISTKFVQNEEVLTTANDYRQVGLLQDPLFANVTIQINVGNTIGAFVAAEKVYEYRDIKLAGSVEVFSNTTVEGTDTFFEDALQVGSQVLITDGISNMFTSVAGIANNTVLTLSANAVFTSSTATISLLDTQFYGYLAANTVGEISLTNVAVSSATSTNKFIGEESFCTTEVNTAASIPIAIAGRQPNNFNTFTQLTKFIGSLNGIEEFIEDETVTQSSLISYAQPEAKFHSFVENGSTDELYVTQVSNIFRTNVDVGSDGIITGSNSEASFTVTAKYNGELVPDSGKILYLESFNPIERSDSQSESVKLIISF